MNRAALKRVLEKRAVLTVATNMEVLSLSTEARPTEVDCELAAAYSSYWTLLETEPLESFQAVYQEIVRMETQATPENAWRTLREAATAFHCASGICPFCRERGPLHLPAEQPELELSRGMK